MTAKHQPAGFMSCDDEARLERLLTEGQQRQGPMTRAEFIAAQRAALKNGRRAEQAGQPVIYIHGRPYADPASETPKEPNT